MIFYLYIFGRFELYYMKKILICFTMLFMFCFLNLSFAQAIEVNDLPVKNAPEYTYYNFETHEEENITKSNESEILSKIDNDRAKANDQTIVYSFSEETEKTVKSFFDFKQSQDLISPKGSSSSISSLSTLCNAPYSGVCQIYTYFTDTNNEVEHTVVASGTFISENAILTSAHVLKHENYGYPNSIRIYYCFKNGNICNFAFCSATSVTFCSTYHTNQDTMYDYGIININSSAGALTKVFQLSTITPNTSTNYTSYGFPSASSELDSPSSPLSSPNTMAVRSGKLNKVASDYLRAKYSEIPLENGVSGGPLVTISSNYYQVLGINTATNTVLLVKYSYFCRIESNVKAFCQIYGDTSSVPTSMLLHA